MIENSDLKQIKEKNISREALEEQLNRFKKGFPALHISRPATLGDGIVPDEDARVRQLADLYTREVSKGLEPLKFVPASGAATRMFKALYQYLSDPVSLDSLSSKHPVKELITRLPDFAFFDELKTLLPSVNMDDVHARKTHAEQIVETILLPEGLNYGNLPKGLIRFHRYTDGSRTAMMEHLQEGAKYASDKNQTVRIHFTVSPEHLALFKDELKACREAISRETGADFKVSFSSQKPYTDTIAVRPDNEPYRDPQGQLLFRPGGHGSLIENLNDQDAGLIFIKNIDNVVPAHLLEKTVQYKKALAGLALHIRNRVYDFLSRLTSGLSDALMDEIHAFARETLDTSLPGFLADASAEERREWLMEWLNRPIRVCGMVKNEGEPGGGPFWVRDAQGRESLQIVESSQVDMDDESQSKLFAESTHFNPVDLVCITRDFEGKAFDLKQFIDPETGFISEKSVDGDHIKALERPGLWNGAMAHWLTLFMEVPGETFNPVKTVNDLLRPNHQLVK